MELKQNRLLFNQLNRAAVFPMLLFSKIIILMVSSLIIQCDLLPNNASTKVKTFLNLLLWQYSLSKK